MNRFFSPILSFLSKLLPWLKRHPVVFLGLISFVLFILVAPVTLAQDSQALGFSRASLDTTCKPCQDFYQFATGGWQKNHPIPAAYPAWGSFESLAQRNKQTLRELLEAAAADSKTTPGSNQQKLGDYYASCMNTQQIEAAGVQPLSPDLAEIDAIQSLSELQTEVAHLNSRGVDVLFGFGSGPDAKNSNQAIAQIGQDGLGLPNRDYYLKSDDKSKQTRQEYVKHISKMFALLGEQPTQAEAAANTVLAVETKLAETSLDKVQLRDPNKTYNKMGRVQLQQLMKHFSWERYFQDVGKPDIQEVNVATPDFFKGLDQQLTTVALPDWKTYLRFHLVSSRASLISAKFDNEDFNFYGRYLQGKQEQLPRWQRCVSAVDSALGEALGEAYVKKMFPPAAKVRINTLIDNLFAVLHDKLSGLDWMSEATRQEALSKLKAMQRKIGYPDRWRDYSALTIDRSSYLDSTVHAFQFEFRRNLDKIGKPVDRREWRMTPPTVNAYYSPSQNEIVFPSGILQPPFFDFNADDPLNYGAIGAVIGHEMSHSFDDRGRQYDEQGNLRNWWTLEDAEKYRVRTVCIEEQASTFNLANGLSINGKLSLGENIADLAGLKLSYAAFQKSLQGKPRPPAIDGFTPEQRFFLGYAQVWAKNYRPEFLRLLLQNDVHAPAPFRVNGPFSNLPEFAAAFGCKQGDPMVRSTATQCKIW